MAYLFLEVAYFFLIIYFNIIMLVPYLITIGFYRFIHYCTIFERYTNLSKIFLKVLLLILNIFFGCFFHIFYFNFRISNKFGNTIFVFISIIFELIYFPLQFIINQIFIFLFFIFNYSNPYSNMLKKINDLVEGVIGFSFILGE